MFKFKKKTIKKLSIKEMATNFLVTKNAKSTTLFTNKRWLTGKSYDNRAFYENIGNELYNYAIAAGMDGPLLKGGLPPDLQLAEKYLDKEGHILDGGSGYGRVIKCLDEMAIPLEKITSVELTDTHIKTLREKYARKGVTVVQADIATYAPPSNIMMDNILWMWCGICDFPKERQLQIIAHFLPFLSPNGVIIIETPDAEEPLKSNVTSAMGSEVKFEREGTPTWNGYMPTMDEMQGYIDQLNVNLHKHYKYTTVTGRNRHLFVITPQTNTRLAKEAEVHETVTFADDNLPKPKI